MEARSAAMKGKVSAFNEYFLRRGPSSKLQSNFEGEGVHPYYRMQGHFQHLNKRTSFCSVWPVRSIPVVSKGDFL